MLIGHTLAITTHQDTVINNQVINRDNAIHRDQAIKSDQAINRDHPTLKLPTNTNHSLDIQITSHIKETLAIQAIMQTNRSHNMAEIHLMEEPQLRVTQPRQDTLDIRLLQATSRQPCKVDAHHPANKIVTWCVRESAVVTKEVL